MREAHQIAHKSATRKNTGAAPKLYARRAPEDDCIAEGQSKTPCELGLKLGIAGSLRNNLIFGSRSFARKPYDSHRLNEQLKQASILMVDTGQTTNADLRYGEVDANNPGIVIEHRGQVQDLDR